MSYVISQSEEDIMTALRAFLLAVLAGYEVVQLQDNDVPMPDGPFVGMRHDSIQRLATNVDTWSTVALTKSIQVTSQYSVGLDFYGPLSGDAAAIVQALLRDEAGMALFPAGITPLFCDNPMQLPLVNGEQNYEQRWRVTAVLEYDPTVTLAQQSATSLKIGAVPVDAAFPP